MAPLTGDCISAIIRHAASPANLAPFSIARFAAS
jgi:hypothetical protein